MKLLRGWHQPALAHGFQLLQVAGERRKFVTRMYCVTLDRRPPRMTGIGAAMDHACDLYTVDSAP